VVNVFALAAVTLAFAAFGAASGTASPVAPACPSSAPSNLSPNGWPPAKRRLAPAGADAIRLCRYAGLNSALASGSLAGSRLVRSRTLVGGLVSKFDQLKQLPPGKVFACPDENGSQVLALLTYPSGERVTILVQTSGCGEVSNGDVSRTASGQATSVGQRLVAELTRLTRR
jgi:hypothetical protein